MLYLVSTPIGNLGDFTFRAVEVLRKCDYILCEDTRHSRVLLAHYEITTPLKSFHQFCESRNQEKIIEDLQSGKTIALISDAGTPLISDPGESLVASCQKLKISVSTVPGPSAVITALTLSGFSTSLFQFLGFLPKSQQALHDTLNRALLYEGTTVCYEAPHRILNTLETLKKLSPLGVCCVARELTKRHEECLIKNPEDLIAHFHQSPPRGEMVLLLPPSPYKKSLPSLSIKKLVEWLSEEFSLSTKEAIKLAAEISDLSKREVYKSVHETP